MPQEDSKKKNCRICSVLLTEINLVKKQKLCKNFVIFAKFANLCVFMKNFAKNTFTYFLPFFREYFERKNC
jgi:hypothetical protein